ncbi:FitA-like ribbon-helix-helix domain-containing protein [Ramlibacter tataouinensis]|uniref:Antitoxin FitA-like ribbon-helix-helix domain-containing protein n=1 Tax=Ramlibacter tataouinensis (strain ATCC BAA-407 / DSM 14655 / LMG 21543 / TTB310) TaxID=365046 RepID=F5Y3V5_RAMTT|nr:Arc family DNA-binding protein [Ramlibacter tataouinensis]AEG91233.1 Hypothetical protein Rta_01690 [Ramlibacter tataouinensis TTB310]
MPNLSIKDVPEAWAEALRQRAARNHRSLQGELMALVEQAVHGAQAGPQAPGSSSEVRVDDPDPGRPRIVGYDKRGWPIVRQGWKTPEQVIAELRQKYPHPVSGQLLGRDIIREDRDSR